ncbi:MAG TPA: glycoside hydrolase family 9 protein [Abditibacteriaceae bacterium]
MIGFVEMQSRTWRWITRGIPVALFASGVVLASSFAMAQNATAVSNVSTTGRLIVSFNEPFLFAYSSWENKVKTETGVALLRGEGLTGQGGAGFNVNLDLRAEADNLPLLRVRVGANNKVPELRVRFLDNKEAQSGWEYVLPAPGTGWVTVMPRDGASFAAPNIREKGTLDLSKVTQWQLQGDWNAGALDVEVDSIIAAAPTTEALQARQAKAERERQERERIAREQQEQLQRFKAGTPLSPRVSHTSLVAPGILSLEFIAGRITRGSLKPYVPQAGDVKDERKDEAGAVRTVVLKRDNQEVGWLIGSKRNQLVTFEKYEGDPLLNFVAANPQTYRLSSPDDPNYRTAVTPAAVFRKSQPIDWSNPGRQFVMRHRVYLQLPQPLQTGKTYNISLGQLNTNVPSVTFLTANTVRSEAIHVNQIGYRPTDPVKRAFLSLWLGTGGRYTFPQNLQFSVVDDKSSKAVFSGKVEIAKAADQPELMWKDKNYNKTDVYRMDFSALKTPGRYRVVVNGVGTSFPFDIANNVWERAFKIQMKGLYNQRSGVDVGPPYSEFKKPRDFYPADGAPVFQSEYSILDGPGETPELAKRSTGVPVPDAWGGYHDAGDWNPRRVTHMQVTMAQLEIFELFPKYFERVELNIPKTRNIPDVLTEALFEIDVFRRLQKPDGGVPYGIETSGDPIDGEVSWLQSMPAYVFKPDPRSSFQYVAVSARAARLLQPYDAKMAGVYRESALRAMTWAEAEYSKMRAAGTSEKIDWSGRDARNLAALELLVLTGDKKWHDTFLEDTFLNKPGRKVFAWGVGVQRDAAFLYARMSEKLGDAALRQKARQAIIGEADTSLVYASNNAWNLTTPDKGKPMFQGFYTTPDAIEAARAHFLTNDATYLRGAVQSTQFQSGANPTNMTFTTGLGANPIQNPLKLDQRLTGQKAPVGITTYGPRDSDWADWARWVHDYFLNKELVPALAEWPVPETYFDIYLYPSTNEYTVDIWTPNVYVWGYLAARS